MKRWNISYMRMKVTNFHMDQLKCEAKDNMLAKMLETWKIRITEQRNFSTCMSRIVPSGSYWRATVRTDLNHDSFNIRLLIFSIVHTIKHTPGSINKIVLEPIGSVSIPLSDCIRFAGGKCEAQLASAWRKEETKDWARLKVFFSLSLILLGPRHQATLLPPLFHS